MAQLLQVCKGLLSLVAGIALAAVIIGLCIFLAYFGTVIALILGGIALVVILAYGIYELLTPPGGG